MPLRSSVNLYIYGSVLDILVCPEFDLKFIMIGHRKCTFARKLRCQISLPGRRLSVAIKRLLRIAIFLPPDPGRRGAPPRTPQPGPDKAQNVEPFDAPEPGLHGGVNHVEFGAGLSHGHTPTTAADPVRKLPVTSRLLPRPFPRRHERCGARAESCRLGPAGPRVR